MKWQDRTRLSTNFLHDCRLKHSQLKYFLNLAGKLARRSLLNFRQLIYFIYLFYMSIYLSICVSPLRFLLLLIASCSALCTRCLSRVFVQPVSSTKRLLLYCRL